jgi:hypothetical protein
MIRGWVDTTSRDLFERNRVRVMIEAETPDFPRRHLAFTHDARGDMWTDLDAAPEVDVPSPFLLDVPRDIAKALYDALGELFAPNDPTPVASDRAYSDARTDIDRLHGMVEKLLERQIVVAPPDIKMGP